MNKQTVSVIVPIYNAEKTLTRCLQSILNQTYKQLEIILVDDGSIDSTYKICQSFAQKDQRITVVQQANRGPAAARNHGLTLATGSFIQFVDADDFMEENMTERLLSLLKQADLAICSYRVDSTVVKAHKEGTFTRKQVIEQFGRLYKQSIIQSPCNKLYKSSLIHDQDLNFIEEYSFGEDLRFNLHYVSHCEHIAITKETLYTYKKRKQSLTTSYIDHLFDQQLAIHQDVRDFLQQQKGATTCNIQDIKESFVQSVIQAATNLIHPDNPNNYAQRKKELKQIMNNPVVLKEFSSIKGNLQTRLFKLFFQAKAIKITFIFLRLKEKLRQTAPPLFQLVKKLSRMRG